MQLVAPAGPVYQAGTLSGNPLAMSAGIAALDLIKTPEGWEKMEQACLKLEEGIASAARSVGIPIQQTRVGTMFTTFFSEVPPRDWSTVKLADKTRYGHYFRAMLENGVYLAPSQFEAGFLSIRHSESVIDETLAAAQQAFKECT